MKSPWKVLVLIALVLAFLIPRHAAVAQATDYVADAIEALQTSNVYVAPGTEGTDSNTVSQLSIYLQPDDNIVLVMLPSAALTGTDMASIVKRISDGLDGQKTIGLAVGDKLIAYSTRLPSDIVADCMINARSVSNSPVTALFTFSRNVNLWVRLNPQPTPQPTPEPTRTPRPTMKPIELPKIDGSTTQGKVSLGFIFLISVIVVFWLGIKLIPWLRRIGKFQPAIQMLYTIQKLLPDIQHSRVRAELGKACKLAWGLVDIYKSSMKYTGIGEDLFPVLLGNIIKQIHALIVHEAYNKLLSDEEYSRMVGIMLNYDDLFKILQKNDPEAIELMAANIMSENTMISHMGHLPTKK